jgi:hypothetical protein
MMMWPCPEYESVLIKGGQIPSQIPGEVTLKARTTVTALAKTMEIATVNITQNVVCCRMQVAVVGWPMKSKEQRKQKVREMSRM